MILFHSLTVLLLINNIQSKGIVKSGSCPVYQTVHVPSGKIFRILFHTPEDEKYPFLFGAEPVYETRIHECIIMQLKPYNDFNLTLTLSCKANRFICGTHITTGRKQVRVYGPKYECLFADSEFAVISSCTEVTQNSHLSQAMVLLEVNANVSKFINRSAKLIKDLETNYSLSGFIKDDLGRPRNECIADCLEFSQRTGGCYWAKDENYKADIVKKMKLMVSPIETNEKSETKKTECEQECYELDVYLYLFVYTILLLLCLLF